MLIFFDANLVLFATPKTGTTAYHSALHRKADIVLTGRSSLKHMPARKYTRHLAPYLQKAHQLTPESAAVIRDPLEHARSWYRYRQRPSTRGKPGSAAGLSFNDFVEGLIAPDPPDFARVGNQLSFVTGREGDILIDHLFAYEKPTVFLQFLHDRLGFAVKTKPKNVSPDAETPIDPNVEKRFRAARAEEFALHDRIVDAGGHLTTTRP